MEKKERERGRERGWEEGRAGLYFPLTSERKETIAAHEVEYKLSSGDRARNQSTSCSASAALSLPPLVRPIVFFIPNFARRHATLG